MGLPLENLLEQRLSEIGYVLHEPEYRRSILHRWQTTAEEPTYTREPEWLTYDPEQALQKRIMVPEEIALREYDSIFCAEDQDFFVVKQLAVRKDDLVGLYAVLLLGKRKELDAASPIEIEQRITHAAARRHAEVEEMVVVETGDDIIARVHTDHARFDAEWTNYVLNRKRGYTLGPRKISLNSQPYDPLRMVEIIAEAVMEYQKHGV
jgi:hypothetical protein